MTVAELLDDLRGRVQDAPWKSCTIGNYDFERGVIVDDLPDDINLVEFRRAANCRGYMIRWAGSCLWIGEFRDEEDFQGDPP